MVAVRYIAVAKSRLANEKRSLAELGVSGTTWSLCNTRWNAGSGLSDWLDLYRRLGYCFADCFAEGVVAESCRMVSGCEGCLGEGVKRKGENVSWTTVGGEDRGRGTLTFRSIIIK